ncbi:MAG: hypothetical protein ABJA37_12745 [Ferruginibacter sp.]
MNNQTNKTPEETKPDLKHDSMEYAASADGEDKLDMDDPENEDDAITAEELNQLEDDDLDDQADALNSAETDSLADEDNFINEKNVEEDYREDAEEDDKKNHQRN